jgi:hypothetical protein
LGAEDKFDQVLTERSIEVMSKMMNASGTTDFQNFILENSILKNDFMRAINDR